MVQETRRVRRPVVILCVVTVIIAGVVAASWRELVESYHVARMSRDRDYFVEALDAAEGTVVFGAVEKYLNRDRGRVAFVDYVLDQSAFGIAWIAEKSPDSSRVIVSIFERGVLHVAAGAPGATAITGEPPEQLPGSFFVHAKRLVGIYSDGLHGQRAARFRLFDAQSYANEKTHLMGGANVAGLPAQFLRQLGDGIVVDIDLSEQERPR